jgi:hypothetical protein
MIMDSFAFGLIFLAASLLAIAVLQLHRAYRLRPRRAQVRGWCPMYENRRRTECPTCLSLHAGKLAARQEAWEAIPAPVRGLIYPARCLWSGTIGALVQAFRLAAE